MHSIVDADMHYLREHVPVVSQHLAPFDATVPKKIMFGSTLLSLEEVQNTARTMRMHNWIMGQERVYNTM